MTINIPWTDKLVLILLKCVLIKEAYLCDGSKNVSQIWKEVHNLFFNQDELEHIKNDGFETQSYRKFREKFKSIMTEVVKDIETGNQSGKEKDLSKILIRRQRFKNQKLKKIKLKLSQTKTEIIKQVQKIKLFKENFMNSAVNQDRMSIMTQYMTL
jgi:hypothetical protein